MSKWTRFILPLAFAVAACSDGPSAVTERNARSSEPSYDVGGTSASQEIDAVADALNAAWVAKSAQGYAAPFAEDSEVLTPLGTTLSGRAAIEARHVILFAGPLAASTYVVAFRRVQFLTGTIAMVDGDAVLTNGPVVTRTLVRWVMTKNQDNWEIAGAQSTVIPPAP